jgi:hypothetical protein
MGWSRTVFLICGAKIEQQRLQQISTILFDKLDFNNENMMDDFWSDIMVGIPIPTETMGSPYMLKQYDRDGHDTGWYIVLDDYSILAYDSNGPPDRSKEIQLPSNDEIVIFTNFLRSKNIDLDYSTFMVVDQ